MELDSHKPLMMSVNVISSHLGEHSRDRPRVEALKARMGAANAEWDRACEDAADWQAKLQTALLEVGDFSSFSDLTSVDYLEKLASFLCPLGKKTLSCNC